MSIKAGAGLALGILVATVAAAQEQSPELFPKAELRTFGTAYKVLRSGYVGQTTDRDLLLSAVKGMARLTDPEGGDFLTDDELLDQAAPKPPENGSIGLDLVMKNGRLTVVAPIRKSPAERAGLEPGDAIMEIDGQRIDGFGLMQGMKLLRGLPGSKVSLLIHRGEGERIQLQIERKVVHRDAVFSERPQPDMLVLRVDSFRASTPTEVIAKLRDEWRLRPFRGVLLDLRRNSGGLLESAIAFAAIFLPPDATVASIEGRTQGSAVIYKAGPVLAKINVAAQLPDIAKSLPLVVLVDEGTASGAELAAAALHHHGRALLVGRRTFGRSSIQTLVNIPGGALRYTSGYWHMPAGNRVGAEGLQPHLPIERGDAQLELRLAVDKLRSLF